MTQFVLPSHMSGEQYITKAALIADKSHTVLLFSGTEMIMRDYQLEADTRGKPMLELYNSRTARPGVDACTTVEAMRARIEVQQQLNLESMRIFLSSGVDSSERRVEIHRNGINPKPKTSGSTSAVADFYRNNPDAEQHLRTKLFGDAVISGDMKAQIMVWSLEKGFKPGAKYCLFWGRKSGEMSGAGLYLDTNEVMLAQMMIAIRNKDPERKLVLIGDRVTVPLLQEGISVPLFDIDLTTYWDKGFPGGRNLSAQLYFIDLIHTQCPDCVSVGTNSGILELPHLLGMKTLYLENDHLHPRKGLRWQLLAPNYGRANLETDLPLLRDKLESYTKKNNASAKQIENVRRQIQNIERHKVDVLHQIRPGLQRFSTSTATELWVLRKSLFDDVRRWLVQPLPAKPGAVANGIHDDFLDAVQKAAREDGNAPAVKGQRRPAWEALHEVKAQWPNVRDQPFAGSFGKQAQTLRIMQETMRVQHGLTAQQQQQFWETFNYAYINTPEDTPAPDVRAGYRAWLRDT